MHKEQKKGISLIVLVITIIVIAVVVVMSLSDSGIIVRTLSTVSAAELKQTEQIAGLA